MLDLSAAIEASGLSFGETSSLIIIPTMRISLVFSKKKSRVIQDAKLLSCPQFSDIPCRPTAFHYYKNFRILSFYISGLAPGQYKLKLDDNFVNAYGLETLPNSEITISIPYDYETPIDITNQNLEYKTLAL